MKFTKIITAAAALCLAAPASVSTMTSALTPPPPGDVNGDFIFNLADIVSFQRWLNGKDNSVIINSGADANGDGKFDVFDLIAMRKKLIGCITDAPVPSFKPKAQNLCAGIESSLPTAYAADEKFINSQTKFTIDMFKKTYADKEDEQEEQKNTLISPYSIMQALAMTANGANGNTLKEMEKVLGDGMEMNELNKYLLKQRTDSINTKRSEYNNKWSMNTANSIWAINDKKRIVTRPEFIQKCVDYFDSEYYVAPFDDTTLNDVNNWVNEKTNKMIPKILNYISTEDVMYLVNAVAFEAEWATPYEEYQVHDGTFTSANGKEQKADMLCSMEKYIGDENTDGIVKYYSGGKYAFAALLPDKGTTIDTYIENLTPEKLTNLLTSYKGKSIEANTKLPKFKYDYHNELSDELRSMGMPTAFSNTADFSNMSAIAEINPIHIGMVIHKTFIELDENGTKAAAATLVAMKENGMPFYEDVKDVVFDRPFVYCIFDTETSLPVFIGALNSLE
jgi:serpin B